MEDFLASIEADLDAFSGKDANTLLRFIDLLRMSVGALSGIALIAAVKASKRLNKDMKTILLTSDEHPDVIEALKPDAVILKNADLPTNLCEAVMELLP